MAKLKAHGIELDRREYPSSRVAVMSDGNIMRDYGQGWKLYKRLKPDATCSIQEYATNVRAKYDARPAIFHEYVKALMDAVPLTNRGRLHTAVSLMPNDPDGVWSELDSPFSGPLVDLDDCVKLCRIYSAAISEPAVMQES